MSQEGNGLISNTFLSKEETGFSNYCWPECVIQAPEFQHISYVIPAILDYTHHTSCVINALLSSSSCFNIGQQSLVHLASVTQYSRFNTAKVEKTHTYPLHVHACVHSHMHACTNPQVWKPSGVKACLWSHITCHSGDCCLMSWILLLSSLLVIFYLWTQGASCICDWYLLISQCYGDCITDFSLSWPRVNNWITGSIPSGRIWMACQSFVGK